LLALTISLQRRERIHHVIHRLLVLADEAARMKTRNVITGQLLITVGA
jgi:hypothetical protein